MKLKADYFKILRHLNRATFSPARVLNSYSLLRDYRSRKPVPGGYPRVLQLETTSRCSLRCIMCPRRAMTRPAEHMEMDTFKSIIDQSAGLSEVAILHLMGDPLLHPQIHEMVSYCRSARIRTVISTNGMALTREASRRLYEAGLDIIILSFDGATREVFERVREGAVYEKVVGAYREFLALRDQFPHKVRTVIQMIEFNATAGEKERFLDMWKDTAADVVIKPFTRWQGDKEEINSLGLRAPDTLERNLCDRAWQWLTVVSDGTVIPCCRDYDASTPLGNVGEMPIREIWRGPRFTAFRKAHAEGRSRVAICRRCDYRSLQADPVARAGELLFDQFALLSLMYDLHYHAE